MSPEILPTENETGNLSLNNLFADYIATNHEVSVDMLDLSVRTYNCLRRNNIMTLSKLILAYTDLQIFSKMLDSENISVPLFLPVTQDLTHKAFSCQLYSVRVMKSVRSARSHL